MTLVAKSYLPSIVNVICPAKAFALLAEYMSTRNVMTSFGAKVHPEVAELVGSACSDTVWKIPEVVVTSVLSGSTGSLLRVAGVHSVPFALNSV